jgi:hypothetical protein
LAFATGVGTPLDAANVRRSFVSIMSDNGVTIEQIANLVGHRTTVVTQKVYRHQLKPCAVPKPVPCQDSVCCPDLTLWGTGRQAGPPSLLSPVSLCSG